MRYHPRIKALIGLLLQARKPLSGQEIGKKLAIKARTLRGDIARHRETLAEDGLQLLARQGVGYELIIKDSEKCGVLLDAVCSQRPLRQARARTPDERSSYLIRSLLAAGDYIRLDDIANEMCVSRSTLNNGMKEVREALAHFGLALRRKSARGVKIVGSELGLRQAFARYFFYDDAFPADADPLRLSRRREIRTILQVTLTEHQLTLTDTGLQNMVVHLEIALMRLAKLPGDQPLPPDYAALRQRSEYPAARQLAARLEAAFGVAFSEAERCIIAIHLSGKRSLSQPHAAPDVAPLIDKVIREIAYGYGIALAEDFELYKLLSLHFVPMLDRLYWGLKIQNPLLQQIKEEHPQSFDMAVLAAEIVCRETGLSLDEAETSYLAVHFALALERGRQQKNSVIVVCASGTGSSQLLLYRIRQRFGQSISRLSVVQLYELQQVDQRSYDVILSTVDIPFQTDIPSLRINAFPEPQELAEMARWLQTARPAANDIVGRYFHRDLFFSDLQSRRRDELISELCQRIARYVAVGDDFTQRVLARERLSATEFGNGAAFPHPLQPGGERTFVAVAVLPATILWRKKKVRYLFLLNVRQGETDNLTPLYASLLSLQESRERLAQLNHADFSAFARLLRQITDKTQDEEIRN